MDKTEREKYFNRREWKRKLSLHLKEHPELKTMSGKTELFTDKGDVLKVRIIDKEI